MKKQTMSRFWKIYAITTVVLLVVVGVGLGIFYDFIRAYERSQPIHAAESYTASLDESILGTMIDQAAGSLTLTYDSAESASLACKEALASLEGEYTCAREYASSSNSPVYIVSCGDTPVAKFSLKESEGGRYGFTNWEAVQGEAILSYLQADSVYADICVPHNSTVRINGIPLEGTSEVVLYPFASEYEKNVKITADLFRVSGLYAQPEVECTLNGVACEMREENGVRWFLYPTAQSNIYSVYAPADAVVTVNGVSVSSEQLAEKEILYTYAPVEATASSLPHEVRYEIPDLLTSPSVQITYKGEKLTVHSDGNTFRAEYPQSQLYTYTLIVPQGSAVTMRGASCDIYRADTTEEAYPGLYSDPAKAPLYDVYTFSGLYLPPANISVIYGSESYSISSVNGSSDVILYPEISDSAAENAVLAFAKDYFTYVSGGYNNTDANLARALAHVKKGSALYTSIQRSLIGISYVTPVTSQTYNRLEVTDMRLLPGDEIYCSIAFDIDQKIYQVSRSYTGSLSVVVEKSGNTWKVKEMLTESND